MREIPRTEKGRQYFWQSPTECAPGVPECELFMFDGRCYAQRYHVSEMLPGAAPMSRLLEVYVRPAKGDRQPESLFEFPSNNRALGAPPQNISRRASDPQGGGVNDFYIEQKGYRYATPADVMRIFAATAANEAEAKARKDAKDPVVSEKLKGLAMGSAMAAALADAFKAQTEALKSVIKEAVGQRQGGARG